MMMINTLFLRDLDVSGKKVLARVDLDVGEGMSESDSDKLKTIIPTINYLLEKKASIILIGHRGRPEGKVSQSLSLSSVAKELEELLGNEIDFVYDIAGQEAKDKSRDLKPRQVIMLENLRFDEREEKNDEGFAKALSELAQVYVNEAFSASHRDHASIVGIPKLLTSALGFHFEKEVMNLSKVFNNTKKPVVSIISGLKEDKLSYIEAFAEFSDKVLIGGRLPDLLTEKQLSTSKDRVLVAQLLPDKEDITLHSVEKFEKEIKNAETILLSGPIGKYEDEGHLQGTKRIFEAVANSDAFKVAGGGDTEQAIKLLGLKDKFDWISVGGGACLEFLAKGTLPGIEAVKGRHH